jgi:RNA recognition motif-containing protein
VTERDLQILCSPHGNVAEVNLPQERERRQPRGFAIVTMATPQGAQAAIMALNGKEVEARVLAGIEHVLSKNEPPATGQNGKLPSGRW